MESQELSYYFVNPDGELIIEFDKDDLCRVVGLVNETWFKHEKYEKIN